MSKQIAVILNLKDAFSSPLKKLSDNIKGTTAEIKQQQRELKKASNTLKSFGKDAISVFKKAGQAVTLGGVAMVAAFGAIGINAIKTAGQFEQYNVSFQTMLGSQQKATKLMGEITKLAALTPFEMPALVEGAKRLVAFGVGANVVTDRLSRLGDLSQGNAEILDRLTLAYGKVRAKGKASLEELNQLTEAGVPIMATLAKQQKTNTAGLFEMVKDGKIGYAEVEKAIISLTSKGGQFYQMNIKQSKTMNGVFSTLADAFNIMGGQIAAKFLPKIKEVATRLINEMPKIQIALTQAFNAATPVIFGLVNTIGFLAQHMNAIIPIASGVLGSLVAFNAISGVIGVINTLRTAITAVNAVQGIWNALMIANPVGVIAIGIGALIAVVVALAMNWDKVTAACKSAFEWLKKVTGFGGKDVNIKVNKTEITKSENGVKPASSSGKKPSSHATGTSYFQGGETRINEGNRGEIIDLPSGARITPHDVSVKQGKGLTINLGGITIQGNIIGNEDYADYIGSHITRKIQIALANS